MLEMGTATTIATSGTLRENVDYGLSISGSCRPCHFKLLSMISLLLQQDGGYGFLSC